MILPSGWGGNSHWFRRCWRGKQVREREDSSLCSWAWVSAEIIDWYEFFLPSAVSPFEPSMFPPGIVLEIPQLLVTSDGLGPLVSMLTLLLEITAQWNSFQLRTSRSTIFFYFCDFAFQLPNSLLLITWPSKLCAMTQEILEKFEFFPIKCRVQQAAEAYMRKSASGQLQEKLFKTKVVFCNYMLTLILTADDLVWSFSGYFLLDSGSSSSIALLWPQTKSQTTSSISYPYHRAPDIPE